MPHRNKHPLAGKFFQISLGANLQAGYDNYIQGEVCQLLDWADRMDQDPLLTLEQREKAMDYYGRRCLGLTDLISLENTQVEDLVCCLLGSGENHYDHVVLLRESELCDSK